MVTRLPFANIFTIKIFVEKSMSLQDAEKISQLLKSDLLFKEQFLSRAREIIAQLIQEMAVEKNLKLSFDEAYVCASIWSDLDDGVWISEVDIQQMSVISHNTSPEATPGTPVCNPSTPGDITRGPNQPCYPSTPGSTIRGPSAPCNPSTPGD